MKGEKSRLASSYIAHRSLFFVVIIRRRRDTEPTNRFVSMGANFPKGAAFQRAPRFKARRVSYVSSGAFRPLTSSRLRIRIESRPFFRPDRADLSAFRTHFGMTQPYEGVFSCQVLTTTAGLAS